MMDLFDRIAKFQQIIRMNKFSQMNQGLVSGLVSDRDKGMSPSQVSENPGEDIKAQLDHIFKPVITSFNGLNPPPSPENIISNLNGSVDNLLRTNPFLIGKGYSLLQNKLNELENTNHWKFQFNGLLKDFGQTKSSTPTKAISPSETTATPSLPAGFNSQLAFKDLQLVSKSLNEYLKSLKNVDPNSFQGGYQEKFLLERINKYVVNPVLSLRDKVNNVPQAKKLSDQIQLFISDMIGKLGTQYFDKLKEINDKDTDGPTGKDGQPLKLEAAIMS